MRGLFNIARGLRLPGHKAVSTREPIRSLGPPDQLVIPLQQHMGEPCEPVVGPGDQVGRGSLLGRDTGAGAPVHAPTSGRVLAVEPCPIAHPSGLRVPAVRLQADGADRWCETLPSPLPDWQDRSPGQLRQRIHACGIVGLGGAGFPTATKLDRGDQQRVHTLIINGVECEPWISCDQALMLGRPAEIIEGARILAHAVGATRVILALEADKDACLRALREALQPATDVELATVPALYPAGDERQLIRTLTGTEVPSGGLPLAIGMLCHNIATAMAVRDAVLLGRPLTSRVVTVTGNAVASPCNVEARIGTPLQQLVQAAGGYLGEPRRLVLGGPMMGFALDSDQLPVIKTSNCLLVGDAALFPDPGDAMPCIRCGACAEVCPARLLPQELYWHARAGAPEPTRELGMFDCIDCGACAVVCPSHIPLVQYFRYAKSELRAADRNREAAEKARVRYLARQERQEREYREQEARRQRKKAALARAAEATPSDPQAAKQAAIQAAIARAKRKKAERRHDGGADA